MSARARGIPKEGTLPSDPRWVVIDASDGDPRRWPANTTPNPDSEGNVNFMEPVSVDDGMAIKWRTHIGQALAEMLKYPDLESKRWVLKDWPDGYQFYNHNKGNLGGHVRHDLYLVGSDTVARFRSPPEFIPHAYWLMTDPTRDRSNCECKYCARKPQRVISDAFGLSQRSGGSPSLAQYVNLPRNERNRHAHRRALPAQEGRVFATVRRESKPIKLPKGPKQYMVPERERDLRALLGPKTLGERRWPREGELVWVMLDYPIPVNERDAESEKIPLWPGIVEEVHLKVEITPRQTEPTTSGGSSSSYLHNGVSNGSRVEDTDPWTIVHKSMYKIRLLVSSKTVLYGADHVLPYQSCAPDDSLLNEVQSFVFNLENGADDIGEFVLPSDSQQRDQAEETLFKRFQSFDPFPSTKPAFTQVDEQRYYTETAVGAFTTAIQIASRLTIYWTPTDEWDYKMEIPLSPSMDIWSTSPSDVSLAEQHALTQKLLGTNPTGQTVQLRFQGLWWGPERIWVGDLVRLKLARYQLAPEGTEIIKKPSGARKRGSSGSEAGSLQVSSFAMQNSTPGQDSVMSEVDTLLRKDHITVATDIDEHMNGDKFVEGHDLGAASRSLFLRVDGLFIAHVSSDDGLAVENECRMCGMLYELADDDWEASDDEYGERVSPPEMTSRKMHEHEASQTPTAARTIPTPLKSVMLNNVVSTITDSTNTFTSHVPPPVPSTGSLFTANPELLSEPAQADVTMLDVSIPDIVPTPVPTSANVPSPLPSAIPSSTEIKTQVDSPVSKTEPSTPSNPSLSGPLSTDDDIYPTPPPPSSLKFRPILRDSHEVVMPLTVLAGRYYPGILSSSPLQARVQQAMQNPDDRRSKAILALEGHVPGAYNSVDATRFLPRRRRMLREAENLAWTELLHYWRKHASQNEDVFMADNI